MSGYRPYNNGYGGGYNRQYGSPKGNYSQSRYDSNRPSYGNGQARKKSGAKSGVNKSGGKWVSGWNKSKGGLVSFLAFQYRGTSVHESKSGRMWENWVVKVENKTMKTAPRIIPCLYDPVANKVIIKELGMVLNPKAPRGGYCGTFYNK